MSTELSNVNDYQSKFCNLNQFIHIFHIFPSITHLHSLMLSRTISFRDSEDWTHLELCRLVIVTRDAWRMTMAFISIKLIEPAFSPRQLFIPVLLCLYKKCLISMSRN